MADNIKEARDEYKTQDEKYDQILADLQLLRVQGIGLLATMMLLGLGLYQVAKVVNR